MTELARLGLAPGDLEITALRAQGPGGQNVNKVASAVMLRLDVRASSLPRAVQDALLARGDRRITRDGVLVIKAQRFRTQERNREDALARLAALLEAARAPARPRQPTRVPAGERRRRLAEKRQRGGTKALRRRPPSEE